MAEELTMPRLSDTMEQGTIGRWVKHEGDAFAEGEVIAEIETDKATMDFQAYSDGTLLKILVGDGESAALGAPIAIVGQAGEEVPETAPSGHGDAARAAEDTPAKAVKQPKDEPAPAAEPAPRPDAGGTLRVSPIARRMADAAGLDLSGLAGRGSGPDGRIVKADVERLIGGGAPAAASHTPPAVQPAPAPAAGDEVRELTPMLKAVARRMAESFATVPHFSVSARIDMTAADALRRDANTALAPAGEKISVNDLIVRACALALIEHPQAHRSYVEGRHVYHAHANVGIAVALDDGLVVPVIEAADRKPLRVIAREARDLAGRARSGGLRQPEIEGGTFTVSNLGMFDVAFFNAIINPPESAILAVGSAEPTPVVRDGEVTVRSLMTATLSVDHRACSGADGARLLQTIRRNLEQPLLLLLDGAA
jgi:pyruvate dehydrogenase E2 component (dihydrolipoamide acetyltransferase)